MKSKPDGSSNVYIYRTYSHENTNGIYENYVLYNVMASEGRNYIIGYEEIEMCELNKHKYQLRKQSDA